MSKKVNTRAFDTSDLRVIPPLNRPVVLKSGGPVMDAVAVEGGKALCDWEGWDEEAGVNTKERHLFHIIVLYSCIPYISLPDDRVAVFAAETK